MIDDRTLCICGHDEFNHVQHTEGDRCTGDLGACRCTLWTPLEPFLQGD